MSKGSEALGAWPLSSFLKMGAFLFDEDADEVVLGAGGSVSTTDKFQEGPAFYLKDFFKDEYLVYRPEHWHRIKSDELLKHLSSFSREIEIKTTTTQDHLYENDFSSLKDTFGEDLKKVVLVSREEYDIQDSPSVRANLISKALTFNVGTPYGLWFDHYGVIGCSPEDLYRISGEELFTFALAGTKKRGEEEELLRSEKDRHEHDLVIKNISETLGPFAKEIKSEVTGIYGYKEIVHLKTNMKAKLHGATKLDDLTNALSPTAALGGYPKKESLAFLRETSYAKAHPKRYFGSAFGLITDEIKHFLVSIRNVQWSGNRYFIESGGGVLPESQLTKELDEIRLKRNTIKKHYL